MNKILATQPSDSPIAFRISLTLQVSGRRHAARDGYQAATLLGAPLDLRVRRPHSIIRLCAIMAPNRCSPIIAAAINHTIARDAKATD